MTKTAIIIPSRLAAQRLPNKPLKIINQKTMINNVYDAAEEVKKIGGRAVITSEKHQTGTDRVFEVFKNSLNEEPDIIINLQGDMPNIDSKIISELVNYMKEEKCDIGTYASKFSAESEKNDLNTVKVVVKDNLSEGFFVNALDFFRTNNKMNNIYHHIGIYGFTKKSLVKFVNLQRSKQELKRKLEQLRALENSMTIHVGLTKALPLSVDTDKDLIEIKKIMEK